MKKLFYLFLLSVVFSNCREDCKVLAEMPYTVEFEIFAGLDFLQTHYFEIKDIPNIKNAVYADRGITEEDVTEIKGRSARMSTIFGGQDYDFIEEIFVRIYTDNPDDYSEIFYRTNVPENIGEDLDLIGSLTNVQRHLQGATFNVVVGLRLRRISPQTIETRFDFRFAGC